MLRGDDGIAGPPKCRSSAAFAETNDAVVGGTDIGFHAGAVDFFGSVASAADDQKKPHFHFERADGRKVHLPEIEIGIEEGDAVGVTAGFRADVTDDADFGLFVFFGPAEDKFLLGRKLVFGKDAGAVAAEDYGGGVLGKDAAVQITPDEEDGDFLRDASAAAHNLWWQGKDQRSAGGGPI